MKTLSSKAPRCDKDQFCDKMTVSTSTVFEISLLNFVVLTRKKERRRKMALSQPHTFAFSCFLRSFWALMSLADLTKKANVKFFPVTKDEYSHKKNHAIFIVRHAIF